MRISPVFSKKEEEGLNKINSLFENKIKRIFVVTKERSVGGGFDTYQSIRFHIQFKDGVELSRKDYNEIDNLFPVEEIDGCLISAYEYNFYDISNKEDVRVWEVLS